MICKERTGRVGPGRHPGPVCNRPAVAIVRQPAPGTGAWPMCGIHVKPYERAAEAARLTSMAFHGGHGRPWIIERIP